LRPSFRPFPLAPVDTVTADPGAVIGEAAIQLQKLGLVVRVDDAPEGYLETDWFDPATRHSQRSDTEPANRVRVRVWADLITPRQTQMTVEAVFRRTLDPSIPEREDELAAPPGSPGDSLTKAARAAVRERFGSDTAAHVGEKGTPKSKDRNAVSR
jgi:hypothetical protein